MSKTISIKFDNADDDKKLLALMILRPDLPVEKLRAMVDEQGSLLDVPDDTLEWKFADEQPCPECEAARKLALDKRAVAW